MPALHGNAKPHVEQIRGALRDAGPLTYSELAETLGWRITITIDRVIRANNAGLVRLDGQTVTLIEPN